MGRFDSGMLSAGTKRLFLAALLLAAFILKCEFIFKHSHYADHLFSDMGFYWQRAHARFNGDYFATDQWFANPPFFPIFLEQFLKILFFLRVSGHELEIAITFFIGLSTLSVLGVYGLAARLTGGFWRAFAAAALYAFAYPILYYNTFILTENLGMPLLILVLWLVMEHEESVAWMAAAGLFFGAAVAIRTAFGLIGLFIFFYLLAARPVSWARLRNALVFSAVFFAVIFFLLVENFFLSKGQVRGLAGYFGFNVFLQYCKVRNAYSGSGFYNNPTFIERHPEFGVFHTNHPFYDRAYFLDLVKGCIHDNPHVWLDNLKLLKDVFLYPPFPVLRDIAGFSFWMPAFCHLTLFLALSIGLFYWISPRERLWRWRMTLLLSPFFCALLMCYFFTMEGRILVPSLFGLYIIFFASVPHLLTNARKTDGYFAGLLLIVAYALTAFGVHEAALLKKYGVTSVQRVDLDKAALRVPDGTPGDQWGFFIMPNVQSGVLLSSKTPREARTLEISTDSMDSYRVLFYSNKKKNRRVVFARRELGCRGRNHGAFARNAACDAGNEIRSDTGQAGFRRWFLQSGVDSFRSR